MLDINPATLHNGLRRDHSQAEAEKVTSDLEKDAHTATSITTNNEDVGLHQQKSNWCDYGQRKMWQAVERSG